MRLDLITTQDGSHTLYRADLDEQYHSVFGAIQESMHIFIRNGFLAVDRNPVQVFEMGFGTGLNTLLTYIESQKSNIRVKYYSIEKFPLSRHLWSQLNFPSILPEGSEELFASIHNSEWDKDSESERFCLHKIHGDFLNYSIPSGNDLVYYDAFSPDKEPELWKTHLFQKIFDSMKSGGILMTYSAKGEVRRNLISCGFRVEKLEGPPGKKHILRAIK